MNSYEVAAIAQSQGLQVELPTGFAVVRLIQQQDLPLDVLVTAGNPHTILGAVDSIECRTLLATSQLLQQVLIKTGTYAPEALRQRIFLVCRNGKWNPAIEIFAPCVAGQQDSGLKEKTVSLVQLALCSLTAGNKERLSPLDLTLDTSSVDAVHSIVEAALASSGGKVFHSEVLVDVGGEPIANLRGRIRSKPDQSDFNPLPLEIQGRLTGFDAAREVLFFRGLNDGAIEINIGKLAIDLVEIARLIVSKTDVWIRLHRTSGRRGEFRYAFVKLLQDQDG